MKLYIEIYLQISILFFAKSRELVNSRQENLTVSRYTTPLYLKQNILTHFPRLFNNYL